MYICTVNTVHTVRTVRTVCTVHVNTHNTHTYRTYEHVCTVTLGLLETSLSENLIYLTVHCEPPSLLCVQFSLIYPTPGLSDTYVCSTHVCGCT